MKIETAYKIGASSAIAMFLYIYFWIFYDSLIQFKTESPFAFVDSFVIPDTYIYHDVLNEGSGLLSIISSTVKNTFVPSAIWYLAGGEWILVLAMNVFFYYLMTGYVIEVCKMYNISYKRIVLLLTFAPVTLFYMVGALKELPTMILLLGFFVNSIRQRYLSVFVIIALLALLRYQIIASIILYILLLARSSSKSLLANAVIAVAVLAGLFPLINDMTTLSNDATELFRQESQGFGIGSIVEQVRDDIIGISSIAVLFRVIQTIFEPLLFFVSSDLINEGVLSVYPVASVLSFLMFTSYFAKFLVGFMSSRLYKSDFMIQKLYTYILTLIVPIAGFSFIHHRYIYPLYPLIIIAVLAHERRKLQ